MANPGDFAYRDPEVANAYGPGMPGPATETDTERLGNNQALTSGGMYRQLETDGKPRPRREIAPGYEG